MFKADVFYLFYLVLLQFVQVAVNTVNAQLKGLVFGKVIYRFEFTYRVHQPGNNQVPEQFIRNGIKAYLIKYFAQ